MSNAAECNGCLTLGSKTFDKTLSKYDVMVVKFDKHNPDQTKHAIFEQVYNDLKDLKGMENMTFAHVDVLEYGIKNQELVNRYELQNHIFADTLPTISIFIRHKNVTNTPENETHDRVQYRVWRSISDGEVRKNVSDFNTDSLKKQIRQSTGIYFTLSGCVDDFDFFAVRFANEFTTNLQKEKIIAEAEKKLSEIPEDESKTRYDANCYIEWMKKAMESGDDTQHYLWNMNQNIYLELNKSEGVSEIQEIYMRQALNILDAFIYLAGRYHMVEAPEHEEL